jgi:hypothetical protein
MDAVPAIEAPATPVTVENFKRAETEYYMAKRAAASGLGKLSHERAAKAVDAQDVIRLNRDTPYSEGVFDLATPLTITKPDGGKRFQSIMVLNQDHYVKKVIYTPGTYTLTEGQMGSRYVYVFVRTFMDPNDPKDMAAGQALQDKVVMQQASPGTLQLSNFDEAQRVKLHNALLGLVPFLPKTDRMFGDATTVDPVQHLVGTAAGWAGNRQEDAIYINGQASNNDGTVPHVIKVRDVPVDAFWSVTVYNAKGFYEAPETAISVNSVTARPDADGGYTVHFGGDPKASNYLRIMPGWNYIVRLYRPRAEVINGSWKFPAAAPVE